MKILFSIPLDLIYDTNPYRQDSFIEVSFEDGPEPILGELFDLEIFGDLIPKSFVTECENRDINFIIELITIEVDSVGDLFYHAIIWADDYSGEYPKLPFIEKP